MENRRKVWYIIIVFTTIALFIFIYNFYKDFYEMDKAMEPITTSTPLHFEALGKTIFINTKVWGLLGNHSRIIVSENEDNYSTEDQNIIIKSSALYYRIQQPDSLFIFIPSMSYSEVRNTSKVLNNIKIEIIEFKASQNQEYNERYKEMGLCKIETN